jgi:transposase
MKRLYYIGLDVHKESVQMAVLGNRGKEPAAVKALSGDPMKVLKAIQPYQEQGKVVAAYEAGCMGYTLCRLLKEHKIECLVIPANKVFHGGGAGEKQKTDKRDADETTFRWTLRGILSRLNEVKEVPLLMLRREEAESIAIPSKEDEAARDLIRCRGDLKEELKRTKQQLLKLLLRKGFNYESDRYWTAKHRAWIKSLKFESPLEKLTCDEYMAVIEGLEQRIERMDKTIAETSEKPEYKETVQKLRTFKGIDYLTALSLVVEIGDFRRFPTAQSFMSYLGLVPSEFSSGSKRKQGGITKTGNSHIRKLLTESSWHYAKPAKVGKALARRRLGAGEEVIAYADKALFRLHGKFTKMIYRGKEKNKAVTAVARELAGFIWGAMNMAA